MRAYLAILRDSFHEALASRVLWILLILTTLFLLALAPLGVKEQAGSLFQFPEILDSPSVVKKLSESGTGEDPSPEARIWSFLSDDFKRRATAPAGSTPARGADFQTQRQLVAELNEILPRRDFYDERAWSKTPLGLETSTLLEEGPESLPADRLARLNRLLIEAAFPNEIAIVARTQVQLRYLVIDLFGPLPLTQEQLEPAIKQALLLFTEFVLGVGGILVAVMVTASIIPQTFEAGAIDLLLSKPVSRSMIYLTKFFGGCSFILINAAYLIGGLWIILGVRWGLWNEKLLLCIPLYMFLFAIYYAISGLAGLLWRNAIVCVVITVLFWGMCFAFGAAKSVLDLLVINPSRITRLVPAGDTIVSVTEGGEFQRWNAQKRGWETVFAREETGGPAFLMAFGGTVVGPVFDPNGDRLLAIDGAMPQMGRFSGGGPVWVGKPSDEFKRTTGINAPAGSDAMFLGLEGEVLVVTAGGVHRLDGNPEDKPQATKVFGFEIPLTDAGAKFIKISPDLALNMPVSAAIDRRSGDLALYDGDGLITLVRDEQGNYTVRDELEFETRRSGIVGAANGVVLLGTEEGRFDLYDSADLKHRQTIEPAGKSAPRFAISSPDGRWLAVLLHNGRLWMYDADAKGEVEADISGQGDLSAAAFNSDGRLLVADRLTRVTQYDPASWMVDDRRQPSMTTWEIVYRYGIDPLYTVFPKPSELGNMVSYLVNDQDTIPMSGNLNLEASRLKLDVWGPIWSNLAFTAVMLAIGCVYVARKDF